VCRNCLEPKTCEYTIHQASTDDLEPLEELVQLFWGDPDQLMFDQIIRVTKNPAFVAKRKNSVVGFIFYSDYSNDAVLIAALGILPEYQGCGIGHVLVERVEQYAKSHEKHLLLVVTSNDNLPALAFYQQNGYQLFEVAPDVIAEKLGGVHFGVSRIPIRDELRLRKVIST
jgi:ribosomal protein S18 acetylase RimI-like enzyme